MTAGPLVTPHPHAQVTVEPCGLRHVGITCRCGHDLGTYPKTRDGAYLALRAWLTHLRSDTATCQKRKDAP